MKTAQMYDNLTFTCPINAEHVDCEFNRFREIPYLNRREMAWKELDIEDKIYYISLYHSCKQKTMCGTSKTSLVG